MYCAVFLFVAGFGEMFLIHNPGYMQLSYVHAQAAKAIYPPYYILYP